MRQANANLLAFLSLGAFIGLPISSALSQIDTDFLTDYMACVSLNIEEIDAASTSITEGANLALTVVCSIEARAAAAKFANTRNKAFVGISRTRKAAAFVSALEQETKKILFEVRSKRVNQ